MKKPITMSVLILTLGTSSLALAHNDAILGAAIGGAAGAAFGNNIGGRDNVIIWSAIGSATGAAIAYDMDDREIAVARERTPIARHIVRERPNYQRVYYVDERDYRHRHGHRHRYGDDD